MAYSAFTQPPLQYLVDLTVTQFNSWNDFRRFRL